MKKFYAFVLAACTALTAGAQTWKLTEMTDQDFRSGGDQQWSFEKYTYATGTFTPFTLFGDANASNYVDIYQPERAGGELFQTLQGVAPAGEFTWDAVPREAWYDTEWTEPSRTDANAKFTYVARAALLGGAFELCGNQEFNALVSFKIPADGYYLVKGMVLRQDGADLKAIHFVPRYRIGATTELSPKATLGLRIPFGAGGAMIEGVTDFRLADGGAQRYTAQRPTTFTFTFHGHAGDVVSFEANYDSLAASAWPRDYYPRTFVRQLDIESVTEAEAKAIDTFVDPFSTEALEPLNALLDECYTLLEGATTGASVGQYPQAAWDELDALLYSVTNAITEGTVNAINARSYMEQVAAARDKFLRSKVLININVPGNSLFISSSTGEDGAPIVSVKEGIMEQNDDAPWGFYSRAVGTGVFEKLQNHDSGNLSGASAWYRGANQWFYITDQGALHPMTDQAPAIMFTAPEDGIYRLSLRVYRPNPNPKVENPLYIRWYHFMGEAEASAKTADAVLAEEFGSVAADGQGGVKPIETTLYAGMKSGDRLAFELDCYTSNRNSSAGTQILDLNACRFMDFDTPITAELAQASGDLFLNPYASGDMTSLQATIAQASQLLASTAEGNAPGQYTTEVRSALSEAIDAANDFIANNAVGTLQFQIDEQQSILEAAIKTYTEARNPVTLQPEGAFSIRLEGTDKYLTKKNPATGYCYAGLNTLADIEADIQKNSTSIDLYNWTFTFTPVEGTNEVTINCEEGYMTPDGYVVAMPEMETDASSLPRFTLVKQEAEDELFAIRRSSDGLYWAGAFTWKSPYDKINTSLTPLYIWRLSNFTIEKALNGETDNGLEPEPTPEPEPSAIGSSTLQLVRSSTIFDLSGRRVGTPKRGIYIQGNIKYVIK